MGLIIFTILAGVLMYFDIISTTAFLCIVGGLVVWFYTAPLLYFKFGFLKFFYHDFLHWHTPDHSAERWSDGLSDHAICKHCGKDIMQDSQGNWFR